MKLSAFTCPLPPLVLGNSISNYREIDFNTNLFFEGCYVLQKYFKRFKEAQLKNRLLKPYVQTYLTFGLNQLIEKPKRSTLHTVFLIDHILTNSKESKETLSVVTIAMIWSNLALLWKFQYFWRLIYNPVEYLWWSFYCKKSKPLNIFTKKLHHRKILNTPLLFENSRKRFISLSYFTL